MGWLSTRDEQHLEVPGELSHDFRASDQVSHSEYVLAVEHHSLHNPSPFTFAGLRARELPSANACLFSVEPSQSGSILNKCAFARDPGLPWELVRLRFSQPKHAGPVRPWRARLGLQQAHGVPEGPKPPATCGAGPTAQGSH